jgi:hypothetical protein
MTPDAGVTDVVTDCEQKFAFRDLLATDYFQKYRKGYYASREQGLLNPYRNYVKLLTYLNEICEYNEQHAKSYAKRLRESSGDWRNAEAVFAELIVYRHYLRPVYEGLITSISLDTAESDVIIERQDGSRAYLEVFCVMPKFPTQQAGQPVAHGVKTHTQNEMASIRQKLLQKTSKQKQFTQQRENFAVIELNDATITGDFSVLSSLSSGYKIRINRETKGIESSGYDWTNSIFDDGRTRYLKGIIYFDLGDYSGRRYLFNPKFGQGGDTDTPAPADDDR